MPTVLITGANRGIGHEFVRQYAAAGWRVHAVGRKAGDLTGIANVEVHLLDVTDGPAVKALARDLNGEAIDVLIANAGIFGSTRGGFWTPDNIQLLRSPGPSDPLPHPHFVRSAFSTLRISRTATWPSGVP